MKKIVLIIDDDSDSYLEIKYALQNENIEVYYSSSVGDGIEQLVRYRFSLVIMGIVLPEIEKIKVLKMIRQIKPIPVLVLSSKADCTDRITAFKAGAHGYLRKPYNLEECLAHAKSLIELHMQLRMAERPCHALIFNSELIINPVDRKTILKGKLLNLTRKEFDLLFYLASHAGQVLSKEQIYRAVWNEDFVYNIDESVKSHIKSLRRKLLPSGRKYIKNEWGVGYHFSPEGDK